MFSVVTTSTFLTFTCLATAHADSRLLATSGVTQLEGSAGGGLVPWALVSGYGTVGVAEIQALLMGAKASVAIERVVSPSIRSLLALAFILMQQTPPPRATACSAALRCADRKGEGVCLLRNIDHSSEGHARGHPRRQAFGGVEWRNAHLHGCSHGSVLREFNRIWGLEHQVWGVGCV